ncbi:hypothetical protein PTS62_003907 [Escherichia coli]|nr:hypothetical protein [Escherichia coli]EEV6305448.1 hypothetical protein [Escherichia coli]EKM0340073.1 hypothetical protein [Escherichia coli]
MLAISSNLSKMIIFIFAIIIIVVLCVITYLYLYKDESLVSKYYINYMAIPENDGVFTWLPDFFPHVAVDISIYTNVEDDYFFSYFSLTNDDGGRFKKTLTVRAREQVAKIVSKNDPDTKKVWCKYGKIPGQGDGVNLFLLVKLMLLIIL